MEIFGLTIGRTKALNTVDNSRSWQTIFESYSGAWQSNVEIDQQAVLAYHAVFSCMTLIASDVSKLRVKLVKQDDKGIWQETTSASYSPVLRKPNPYQTRIQFWESWLLSKLSKGNTYVLKKRDNRRVVTGLYILDPDRVRPMVGDDGAVWYELKSDNLAVIPEAEVMVPASEIIHDRFNCLFHPLVGISPIYACGLASTQGLRIQNNSANFFGNASKPGGLLVAPGRINDDDAKRLKEYWDSNFTGANAGKIAVLGDGLKYEGMTVDAKDSQLIEQLGWTAEVVCSTFHVPPYKVGVGALPSYNNVQALNVEYYSQCLQVLIEAIEVCLDEGLATGEKLGTEFDVENLLRMDGVTQMQMLKDSAGILSPNEMRAKLDKPGAEGGESPMVQQQNYSLAALAKRDAMEDPFDTPKAEPPQPVNDNAAELQQARALLALTKGLS